MNSDNYDALYDSDLSDHTIEVEPPVHERNKQQSDQQFLKGCAISMWQNSGDADSNWTRFTKKKILCGLKSTIKDGTIDVFPDTWNRFREDVKLLKELGCNAFRLSIEWERIEPEKGKFDNDSIQRYHEIFDCLDENEITPCVTLHHFVHPGWFEDLGGFEKEENISLFVNYSLKVYEAFGERVNLWATFNEPTVYTFCSYLAGLHAPGKSFQFALGGRVLCNMLKAHCETYNTLKKASTREDVKIGIVHHHIWFKPVGNSPFHALAKFAGKWMTFWWGRDLVLHFFKTGKLNWKIPFFCGGGKVCMEYKSGEKPPLDWWGINYYSRVRGNWKLNAVAEDDEVMTEMNYPIYPKGLYRCIAAAKHLEKPIYITETGIADSIDDKRHLMIKGYTNELLRAIRHGHDVRGIFYWTLIDNFEWNLGYKVRFGLYEFNPTEGVDRKLRHNAKELQQIYHSWPDTLVEMYKYSRRINIPRFEDITSDFVAQQREDEQQAIVLPSYD